MGGSGEAQLLLPGEKHQQHSAVTVRATPASKLPRGRSPQAHTLHTLCLSSSLFVLVRPTSLEAAHAPVGLGVRRDRRRVGGDAQTADGAAADGARLDGLHALHEQRHQAYSALQAQTLVIARLHRHLQQRTEQQPSRTTQSNQREGSVVWRPRELDGKDWTDDQEGAKPREAQGWEGWGYGWGFHGLGLGFPWVGLGFPTLE